MATVILIDPAANSLKASQRPIYFSVQVGGAVPPPVVYCDVYINSVYYKTVSKTQYAVLTGSYSNWDFFIQGAVQEVLTKTIGPNGGSTILNIGGQSAAVFCRFRASALDSNGFILPDVAPPVQATGSQPAVGSGGTQSNTFYVVNSVLQHHHNQDLNAHLNFYKSGTWAVTCFPLSHRKDGYLVEIGDSDYFPLVSTGSPSPAIEIWYRNKGQVTWFSLSNTSVPISGSGNHSYLIPAGPKNLAALFPSITWLNLKEYYLKIYDGSTVIATTPLYTIFDFRGTERVRIHFLNYLGTFDAVNFLRPKVTNEATSSTYTSVLSYPLKKTDTGTERYNVRSNDTYEAKRNSTQDEKEWLEELNNSPKAFMDWDGIEGQADDYLPIVITSGKFDKVKNQGEHEYDFVIQYTLSNDHLSIRN